MSEQNATTERCGFISPTPGYAPCTRKKGHPSSCAHHLAKQRTVEDAIDEAERLMQETLIHLHPDNDRDAWFMVRLTKILVALSNRPVENGGA